MKKVLVLFLAVLGVLCFSSLAVAEGFAVSADYSFMGIDEWDQDLTALTLRGEYDAGSLLVGGSYLFALSYDPAPPSGTEVSDNWLCLYGGYKLLDEDVYGLALIGGYSLWSEKLSDGIDTISAKVSSIGAGAKGTLNLEPINVSALLLYGISNDYKVFLNGSEMVSSTDVSLLYLELKGSYQFTDSLGVFGVYRRAAYSIMDNKVTVAGFGLGVDYRF